MAEHGPFGRAAGTARVNDRREVFGLELTRSLVNRVGILSQPIGACGPERVKGYDERVAGTPRSVSDDHAL